MEFAVTAVLGAIAAAGAVYVLAIRPRHLLVAGARRQREPGKYRFRVANDGTAPLLSVTVQGYGCSHVRPRTPMSFALQPGERRFITLACDEPETAWFLLTWDTPSAYRGRRHAMWLPLDSASPLGRFHEAQRRMGSVRQWLLRTVQSPLLGPGAALTGTVQRTRRTPARVRRREAGLDATMWPRYWISRLLRGQRLPRWERRPRPATYS